MRGLDGIGDVDGEWRRTSWRRGNSTCGWRRQCTVHQIASIAKLQVDTENVKWRWSSHQGVRHHHHHHHSSCSWIFYLYQKSPRGSVWIEIRISNPGNKSKNEKAGENGSHYGTWIGPIPVFWKSKSFLEQMFAAGLSHLVCAPHGHNHSSWQSGGQGHSLDTPWLHFHGQDTPEGAFCYPVFWWIKVSA